MDTRSEPSGAGRDFHGLFRDAQRQVIHGGGSVRELRIDLEGPPLWAHSRLLSSGGLLYILGENLAGEDLTLRHEGAGPMVAVHAPLRGSAAATMDGLGGSIA